MSFVTTGLAFGVLLFAVPLIIHLLNRQRFRRREWAAMEYLLRAFKKQRRRIRTENLILLLLRCLIPILLALALARPFFEDGSIVPTSGTVHHVMVFDRSYSMGYQPAGSQSPYTKAVRIATRRLEQLDNTAGQKVTLVLAGIRPEIPIRGAVDLAGVRARLARLGPPSDSNESLVPALSQVADMLDDEKNAPEGTLTAATRVYVFTDLQKNVFGDLAALKAGGDNQPQDPTPTTPPGDDGNNLAKEDALDVIERIQKHGTLQVMDTGGAAGTTLENVQISELRLERSHAVVGVGLLATVKVRNLSAATQNVEVTLEKDIGEPTRRLIRVDAGAETELPFQVVFRTKGKRQLRATIQADGLEADNTCYRVVDVQERIRVLMVEGSEFSEYRLMDSGWLRAILDPTQGRGDAAVTQFATKTIDADEFLLGQEKLQDYNMIVLANVERLTEDRADELTAAVEAGSGLLIALGARTDVDTYNTFLYRDGNGPLAIRLLGSEGYDLGGTRLYRNQVADNAEHPVFVEFKNSEPLLQALHLGGIYKYFRSEPESLSKNAKVIWRISNPALTPLMIAGRHGEGRTLLLTSNITQQPEKWNTLDALVHSVPLFHPMAHWLSHPAVDPYNVAVGASLTAIVKQRPRELAVVVSDRGGGGKRPIARDAKPLRAGMFALPPFTQTDHAGIYTFEMDLGEPGSAEQVRLPFAVNPDPREGELTFLNHSTLKDKLGIDNIYTALPDEDAKVDSAGLGEIGPLLLYLVLFFILGEASWARFVSRRRM